MFAASKTAKAASAAAATDPQFPYVTMLLHGDGTNGAQNNTFLDSSTNNFTITRNGNTTQGTFTPYGSNWSNYFNGSSYFSIANNTALQWSTGDFCVEAWIFPNSVSGSKAIVCKGTNNAGTFDLGLYGNKIELYTTALVFSSTTTISANTWTHVAVTRSGTTLRCFINGALDTTVTSSYDFNNAGTFYVGVYGSGAVNYFNGYMSNIRCVKGSAVYTSAFTPSTTPLTAISGTSLLTCQSNRFIDNSTNAFTLTVSGSPSVQRFSPFSPTTAYSTSVIGGSGYFDGSGDYLTIPDNSAWVVNTDYTVEFWCYASSFPGQYNNVFNQRESPSLYWGVNWDTSLGWCFFWNNGSGETKISRNQNSPLNTWVHVAIVKSGTTGYMFLNGVQAGATFTLGSINDMASLLYIGTWPTISDYFAGYISNMRFVKGTALYTSTFTPNTAPLTAITNTVLLLNTTNAGIFDNAMMNDLETVGNAQISTSVKKFGTGSLAFDGTDDRLTTASSPNMSFGTGDFTIEGWFYINSGSGTNNGALQISGTTGGLQANQTNNIALYSADSSGIKWGAYYANTFAYGSASTTQTWTHVALVRSSGSLKLYINGTADATFGTKTDTTNYTGQNICVGGYYSTLYLWNGYIDDLRITKGYARYTSNFTPPTAAFPNN